MATLGKEITATNYIKALNELNRQGISLKNNPFVEVLTKANPTIFKEVIKMESEQTFEEVIREWGFENGMVDRISEMKVLAKKMLSENEPIEKIVFYTSLSPETIKAL